ncbi:hypothetical protein TEA_005554 [Camellia sinensis var. sinensis]|uniref:3'-5' exonuclease domain-containing protein n=1 Tax=Camellia sinensis var. sinensis TaxID=542762 RepID=A0A4V3WQZ2_CAMSN|nr:hypothetical protein TEA_005554 [Camellia sinensis var. sinensis]
MEPKDQTPLAIDSVDSPEFTHFTRSLSRSSVIGLDAEWKPLRSHESTFPTVSLLQIACRLSVDGESSVFLLDLLAIPLRSIYPLLRDVFVSPGILKLGFRFKQDLAYLSSTFCSQDCDPGFDRELQCSDWSHRPLTEEQKAYAAADAHCLLEIFNVFQINVIKEGTSFHNVTELGFSYMDLGLKEILEKPSNCDKIVRTKFCEASEIVRATTCELSQRIPTVRKKVSTLSYMNTIPLDDSLLYIVRKYGDKIVLKESDRKPKTSKKKGKRKSSEVLICKERRLESIDDWQGPPPWDLSLGGNGFPKFLCDVMVEGLAKHLRCVGIDAAVPHSKKPETRDLIDQAHREKRVLLTRDAKLLRHEYLIKNQIYRVKNLLKNEQLLEVIETFQLKVSEDQLMSRCTKCNGKFIQKPLSTEEAVEAAKGFQVIPNCLFDKNLQFWQCMDCNQLYWENDKFAVCGNFLVKKENVSCKDQIWSLIWEQIPTGLNNVYKLGMHFYKQWGEWGNVREPNTTMQYRSSSMFAS